MLKRHFGGVFNTSKIIGKIRKSKLLLKNIYNIGMLKVRIPFAHAKSIYEIDGAFFTKLGVKYVLADLDNTLDSYRTKFPTKQAIELKERLAKDGIELIIVSNNTGNRVSTYANALGVRFLNSVGKPFASRLLKKLAKLNIKKEEVIMIGDQVVTDITCANRAKIKSVLTDKIVKEDQITTRFNRLFDRPLRRSLKRKNLLVDWRNI